MIRLLVFRIFFLGALLLGLFPVTVTAQTAATVTVIHMAADPSSPNGYKEIYRWLLSSEDQWARIHNNIDTFQKKTESEVNPFTAKEKENDLIVLVQNDRNGVTGEDFYLSKKGIMRVTRKPFDIFYRDTSSLKKFLEEELKRRVNYTETNIEGFPITSPGVVVAYDINETLKNPMWHVTDPRELKLYDSFFRGINRLMDDEARVAADDTMFDQRNNFFMYLNYKEAPARFVTVTDHYIRLSRVMLTNSYHEDPGKYFEHFLEEAKNQTMSESDRQRKMQGDALRRKF